MPLLKSTQQNSPTFNGVLAFFTLFWNSFVVFMGITMWRQGDVATCCFFYHYRSRLVADRHLRVGSLRQPWEGMNLAKPEVVLSRTCCA